MDINGSYGCSTPCSSVGLKVQWTLAQRRIRGAEMGIFVCHNFRSAEPNSVGAPVWPQRIFLDNPPLTYCTSHGSIALYTRYPYPSFECCDRLVFRENYSSFGTQQLHQQILYWWHYGISQYSHIILSDAFLLSTPTSRRCASPFSEFQFSNHIIFGFKSCPAPLRIPQRKNVVFVIKLTSLCTGCLRRINFLAEDVCIGKPVCMPTHHLIYNWSESNGK